MLKLVIPAYREVGRLPAFLGRLLGEIERRGLACELLIVDDGSPVSEQRELRAAVAAVADGSRIEVELLAHASNRGKGHAIRSGWAENSGYSHLAFVDADECVPADVTVALLAAAVNDDSAAVNCWIGSRRAGSKVRRNLWRRLASRLYADYVRACLGVPVADYQCGLKVVRAETYRAVAPRLQIDGFAFDSELLAWLHAGGTKIAEIPVPWDEKAGRRWSFLAVALGMARDVWRIRRAVKRSLKQ